MILGGQVYSVQTNLRHRGGREYVFNPLPFDHREHFYHKIARLLFQSFHDFFRYLPIFLVFGGFNGFQYIQDEK